MKAGHFLYSCSGFAVTLAAYVVICHFEYILQIIPLISLIFIWPAVDVIRWDSYHSLGYRNWYLVTLT